MMQSQFLRLNPLGLALGCAAAALAALIVRAISFGFGLGAHPYMHGPYGGGLGMMQGGFIVFALLAAVGFIVFCGILGAIVAWIYNAASS